MNNIQKALEMQDIYVAWVGEEPEHYNLITKAYMADEIDGRPRMIRSSEDTGKQVVITKLKNSFKILFEQQKENDRNKEVVDATENLIASKISIKKQVDLVTESVIINNNKTPTKKETKRLSEIVAQMQWIMDVKELGEATIADGTELSYIDWPKFP